MSFSPYGLNFEPDLSGTGSKNEKRKKVFCEAAKIFFPFSGFFCFSFFRVVFRLLSSYDAKTLNTFSASCRSFSLGGTVARRAAGVSASLRARLAVSVGGTTTLSTALTLAASSLEALGG